MQDLAREMNFSETTFVLPPELEGAQKKVRIFTPAMEMPMAGHPTVGTAAVLVDRGLVDLPASHELILELGIGPVKVEIEPQAGRPPFVWMNHRMPQFTAYQGNREEVANRLGVNPEDVREDLPLEIVSTGVPFLFVPLTSLDAIGRARSEPGALASLFEGVQPANVALFTQEVVQPDVQIHARMYSPHLAGISEDPATGSMAAPLGAYLVQHGVLDCQPMVGFTIEQGIEMHRPSLIRVEVGRVGNTFQSIRIGGDSVLVGQGEIFWE
jgi:trans-2,3-dihydro-3-hydroxyanthranilate isomerase